MTSLKVGELAKLVGVSVRSLHHYDELGLLKPSAGRRSQHRIYDATDVARLQQIISLKSVGLTLAKIKQCLQSRNFDLKTSLTMQREMIEKKIDDYKNIGQLLRLMLSRLDQHQNLEMEELLILMKEIKQMENIYTKSQLQKLKDRYEKYGLDKVKEVEDGWLKLFKEFEIALQKGLAPQSPGVQILAKQAQSYIDMFTGEDKEIEVRLD
jgi:MerR family transcriptional regulator, thiopeptide resistance regulator